MHDFEFNCFQISIVIPNLRCGFPLGWGKVFIGSVKNLFQPNDLRQVGKLLFLVEIFVIGIDAQLIDWLLKTLQVPPEALVGDVQQLGGELGFQRVGIGAVRQGILGLLILLRLLCVIGGVFCQGGFEPLRDVVSKSIVFASFHYFFRTSRKTRFNIFTSSSNRIIIMKRGCRSQSNYGKRKPAGNVLIACW